MWSCGPALRPHATATAFRGRSGRNSANSSDARGVKLSQDSILPTSNPHPFTSASMAEPPNASAHFVWITSHPPCETITATHSSTPRLASLQLPFQKHWIDVVPSWCFGVMSTSHPFVVLKVSRPVSRSASQAQSFFPCQFQSPLGHTNDFFLCFVCLPSRWEPVHDTIAVSPDLHWFSSIRARSSVITLSVHSSSVGSSSCSSSVLLAYPVLTASPFRHWRVPHHTSAVIPQSVHSFRCVHRFFCHHFALLSLHHSVVLQASTVAKGPQQRDFTFM